MLSGSIYSKSLCPYTTCCETAWQAFHFDSTHAWMYMLSMLEQHRACQHCHAHAR